MAANVNLVDIKPDVKKTVNDFDSFKVALAEDLTDENVIELATVFNYPPAIKEKLETSASAGRLMIIEMEERGQIEPTSILILLCALKKMGRFGIEKRVRKLYEDHTGILCSSDDQSKAQIEEKKNKFTKYSRIAYQKQYGTAKPFPSMNEGSVDNIFVEGGIYYVAQKGDSKQTPDVLESLESYNEILSSPKTKSKRKIIEGEPGYGKSTIGLQYLHDWCTKNPTSPLKDVKILIYLQLRQLAGVKSIYTAIKNFIVPKDENMDEACIQEILRVYKESVVMIFDSYDEYPDKNETGTDISSIIEMEMFQDSIVMILTRTLNIPPNLHPETKSIRLTGFGVAERRNYVLKVVDRNNVQLADWIEEQLQRNPVLKDLCQVPLLFTMVAHTVHKSQNIEVFNSLTRFFKYLIACFHNHMKSKKGATSEVPAFETKLPKLYRIVFEGLTQRKQQLSWKTTYLVSELGQEFYDYYIDLGMLAQEEVFDMLQCIHLIEARMSHKIICEFYASHHLVRILSEGAASAASSINVKETLNSINPLDLQYIYRFACGLNKSAADIIIKHLSETKEGRQFAILCTLEQEEKSDQFLQSVKDLVSSYIAIKPHDSKLLQRSTIQVLEVASANQIPITSVCLNKSFKECEKDVIVLHSGLRLNQLLTVEKIHIETEQVNKEPRILTEEDVTMIFRYGLRSEHLKDLSFDNCLLPPSFAPESIPAEMKSREIKVSWGNYGYSLNLQSGAWKVDDVDTVKRLCKELVAIRKNDSELLQRCNIQLLENASYHDIPISQLLLKWSYSKVDKGDIVIQSGLCLPTLSTLEKLFVNAKAAELTEEDVIGLLNYGVQSRRFQELWFYRCKLPTSISPEMILETARSRNIKVLWPENASQLELQSGKWKQAEDIQTITELCSNVVGINNESSLESQKSAIELLKKASRHDIPIVSVVLVGSFNKVDEDDITLYSGLSLPILTSIERMNINTENGREMNKHEVNGILNYVQHSQRFKLLSFYYCLLPPTIASSSLANLEARNVNVFWIPYGNKERQYRLDLQSGRWRLHKDPESFFPHSLHKVTREGSARGSNYTKYATEEKEGEWKRQKKGGVVQRGEEIGMKLHIEEELTDADYAKEVEAFRNRYSEEEWQVTYNAS
ncbi:uncharacterized protein [Apostichopus japonicus]|uniref:uncharacterized protein isoform X1 n=1 Tax=Stichopus japonicus TaxID=307972 RepID=UPI003AB5CE87